MVWSGLTVGASPRVAPFSLEQNRPRNIAMNYKLDTTMAALSLFCDSNMAVVPSCENTRYKTQGDSLELTLDVRFFFNFLVAVPNDAVLENVR